MMFGSVQDEHAKLISHEIKLFSKYMSPLVLVLDQITLDPSLPLSTLIPSPFPSY